MAAIFFLGVYLVLCIPFFLVMWVLVSRIKRCNIQRGLSIVVFAVLSSLLMSPIATPMATLFVGGSPIGYALIFIPFEDSGYEKIMRALMGFWKFHSIGFILTFTISALIGFKVFPIKLNAK